MGILRYNAPLASLSFTLVRIFFLTSNLKSFFMSEMDNQSTGNSLRKKSIRGFAAMDSEKQREIARKGGRAAHEQGVAHEWSSQEAREAGKKGGQARGSREQSRGSED
jgi:general stress protein YciG